MVAACGSTTARDPLMLAAHRKARRDSPANDNTEVLSVAAEPVALSEQLRPLVAALAFVSEGRYREATPDEPATILIVQPGSGAEIRELRRRYPDRAIVVWDRAGVPHPQPLPTISTPAPTSMSWARMSWCSFAISTHSNGAHALAPDEGADSRRARCKFKAARDVARK